MGFEKSYLGVLSGLAAFFLYSIMDVTIKLGTELYPLPVIIFMQSAVILTILCIYAFATGRPFVYGSAYPRRQLVRVFFHVISGYSGYTAFTNMPLATFYTVGFMGPLLISLMAWVVYKDAPTKRTWLALGVGFVGMLIIARPDTLPMNTPTLFALIWIFFSAVNVMFVRSMPQDHPNTFAAYTHTGLICFALTQAWPYLADFNWQHFIYPLAGGVAAAGANYMFYNAYRMAPSSLVAPTQYSQLVWGALAGWVIFNATLTVHLFMGAGLIACAGWLVVSQAKTPVPSHVQRRVPRVE